MIKPADRYHGTSDLGVVSCYFNPCGFESRYRNIQLFEQRFLRSGIDLVIIECAAGDAEFQLKPASHVVRLRARDCLFQKERLLNLAVAHLPRHLKKVAWLDCDILFEREDWAIETSRLLDDVPVVQPFYYAFQLERERLHFGDFDDLQGKSRSFAATHRAFPSLSRLSGLEAHGHTGFAWAARRSLLDNLGLYDAGVPCGADDLMAHGFRGDFRSPCLEWVFRVRTSFPQHFKKWAESAWDIVRGQLGFVPGAIFHLWHGEPANRGTFDRSRALVEHDFDPLTDLRLEGNGLWRWSGANPELEKWVAMHFMQRQEDTTV